MRPEIRLLLACVRRDLPPQSLAEARGILLAELDWPFLLREAHRHSVLPLLYRGLLAHFAADAPAAQMDVLREACRQSQRRNLAITAELLRILRALENARVPAIPFKGPVLAALVYGDLSLRTFGDLDVLVHENDLSTAQRALIAEGYIPEFSFRQTEERAFRKAECAVQLRHPERDVVVELHWLLTERYLSIDLAPERFWTRPEFATVAGRTVPTLTAEDLLLYLCVHGGKHRWERLEWLCSFSELIATRRAIRWDEVRRRARETGTTRLLHVGLLLGRELLDLDLPAGIVAHLEKDLAARRLAAEIADVLFEPGTQSPDTNRGSWYLYLLRSRERWSDRARIVLFSFVRRPHPSSEELVSLPARLSFLYYLFRPVRMFTASLAAAWRYRAGRRPHPARTEQSEPICTR